MNSDPTTSFTFIACILLGVLAFLAKRAVNYLSEALAELKMLRVAIERQTQADQLNANNALHLGTSIKEYLLPIAKDHVNVGLGSVVRSIDEASRQTASRD